LPFLDHEHIGIRRTLAQALDAGVPKVRVRYQPGVVDVSDQSHDSAV
jgi:hypothetical protein